MKFREFKEIISCDFYRIAGSNKTIPFLKQLFFGESFKYIFWMRATSYFRSGGIFQKPLFFISYFILKHYRYKFGIYIPDGTQIGKGLYIGHFGGIIINPKSVIGKNCNLSHGVTLGTANRGSKKGVPVIGDNVYIGPGAKIIGAVKIGNNSAIGANCVVTKDVPDNGVAVGIPSKIISYDGSAGYVNQIKPD